MASRQPEATFQCDQCTMCFSNYQSFTLHKTSKHHISRPIAEFVDSSVCAACLLQLFTIERARNHADKSERCKFTLMASVPRLSPEALRTVSARAKGEARATALVGVRRHHASRRAIRAFGPLTLTAAALLICHDRRLATGKKINQAVLHSTALALALFPHQLPPPASGGRLPQRP